MILQSAQFNWPNGVDVAVEVGVVVPQVRVAVWSVRDARQHMHGAGLEWPCLLPATCYLLLDTRLL